MSDITDQIKQALKDRLELEVHARSNDPSDDGQTLTVFFDGEEVASVDL